MTTSTAATIAPRWRFRLRTLLLLVVIAAVVSLILGERFFRSATIPLSAEVERFNREAAEDSVGRNQPPLTEVEVKSVIEKQLPQLPPEWRSQFERIATMGRLPANALFIGDNGYTHLGLNTKPVWWVNLHLTNEDGSGFGLRIRENNAPNAAER
jgi:hypothetical protein